jgi:hypothetical protein
MKQMAQGSSVYLCRKLLLSVGATQSHVERATVELYKRRMTENASYCPTVLLYAPNSEHMDPQGWFGRGALLLDGHHKLAAAYELGRELQFVLVDLCLPCLRLTATFPFQVEE